MKRGPLAVAETLGGLPSLGGGAQAVAARAAVARLLWNPDGSRRVLANAGPLDRALAGISRGGLERLAEHNPLAPVYLFPTRAFARALARRIRACGERRVLEVSAGDGHLAALLAEEAPDLEVAATDSGAWRSPAARMNARERRRFAGKAGRRSVAGLALGANVRRLEAAAAIRALRPGLVLASWLPPGPLLSRLIRAPVRWVLEIGAGSGVTGDISCWRFEHEFCEELDGLARCRLDGGGGRATKVTLYRGAAHREFAEERIGPGHLLWRLRAR